MRFFGNGSYESNGASPDVEVIPASYLDEEMPIDEEDDGQSSRAALDTAMQDQRQRISAARATSRQNAYEPMLLPTLTQEENSAYQPATGLQSLETPDRYVYEQRAGYLPPPHPTLSSHGKRVNPDLWARAIEGRPSLPISSLRQIGMMARPDVVRPPQGTVLPRVEVPFPEAARAQGYEVEPFQQPDVGLQRAIMGRPPLPCTRLAVVPKAGAMRVMVATQAQQTAKLPVVALPIPEAAAKATAPIKTAVPSTSTEQPLLAVPATTTASAPAAVTTAAIPSPTAGFGATESGPKLAWLPIALGIGVTLMLFKLL